MVHFATPLRHPPTWFTLLCVGLVAISLNIPAVLHYAGHAYAAWYMALASVVFCSTRSFFIGLPMAVAAYNKMDTCIDLADAIASGTASTPTKSRILHVVLITCYKEPVKLIKQTMQALAAQRVPMVILLALEQRDAGAESRYEGAVDEIRRTEFIKGVHVSIHPRGIPGELPGKCSNANYSIREFFEKHSSSYVDQGFERRRMIVASCDADSVFASDYFVYLNHLIERNELLHLKDKHARADIWVPTVVHTRNPLRTNNIVAYYVGWIRMYIYAAHVRWSPSSPRGFVSNYHIPLTVMQAVDFWTPDVIAEDVHFFNKLHAFALKDSIEDGSPYDTLELHMVHLPSNNQTPNHPDSIFATASELFEQNLRWMFYQTELPYWIYQYLAQNHSSTTLRTIKSIVFNTWDLFYAGPFLQWANLLYFGVVSSSDPISTYIKYMLVASKIIEAYYPMIFMLLTKKIAVKDHAMANLLHTESNKQLSAFQYALFIAAWPIATIAWSNIIIPLTTLLALKKCILSQATHDTSASKTV